MNSRNLTVSCSFQKREREIIRNWLTGLWFQNAIEFKSTSWRPRRASGGVLVKSGNFQVPEKVSVSIQITKSGEKANVPVYRLSEENNSYLEEGQTFYSIQTFNWSNKTHLYGVVVCNLPYSVYWFRSQSHPKIPSKHPE